MDFGLNIGPGSGLKNQNNNKSSRKGLLKLNKRVNSNFPDDFFWNFTV